VIFSKQAWVLVWAVTMLLSGVDMAARAEGLPGNSASGGSPNTSNLPIEVEADQSLEWYRDQRAYVARGHAVATRGEMSILADTLVAYDRDKIGGGTEVWRLTADGSVTIKGPNQQAFGDQGVYDIDRKVAVLTGKDLKFTTLQDTITARDSLEYWQDQDIAVARGNAVAVRQDRRVKADTLTALFKNSPEGQKVMDRVNAEGHVIMTTATDVVTADRAVYSPQSNTALLTGSVKITRGQNHLQGDRAEVDFATGQSRLLTSDKPGANKADGGKPGRVKALLVPGSTSLDGKKAAPTPSLSILPREKP
jgi:lipopolysaccharide export system protein LptA